MEELQHIYVKMGWWPPNITTFEWLCQSENRLAFRSMLPLSALREGQSVVWCWSIYQHLHVMIHPSRDQQEYRTVVNVKIEEICSACLSYCWKKTEMLNVSCCLFSEPSGMPAGVWARSVSASEIEVNWQALSFTPERVLGYEVHFTLLNGNRNHTQHNSNACHHPRCTSKPSLPNSVSPWKWLFQLGDCYCQNYTVLCRNKTGKHVTAFSREQKKIVRPHAFSCCCHLWSIMIWSFLMLWCSLCCNTIPDLMSEYQKIPW